MNINVFWFYFICVFIYKRIWILEVEICVISDCDKKKLKLFERMKNL